MGLWAVTKPKEKFTATGKDGIALVDNIDTSLGVVFDTDAAQKPEIKVAGVFPDGSHPPIMFSFALTTGASREVANLSTFLRGSDAVATFQRLGFHAVRHARQPFPTTTHALGARHERAVARLGHHVGLHASPAWNQGWRQAQQRQGALIGPFQKRERPSVCRRPSNAGEGA